MPTAYGYARVSGIRQAESGLGLEAQDRTITEYYDRRLRPMGIPFGGLYIDPAITAKKKFLYRPKGMELHSRLLRGDHVIVAKLDRAFRNMVDFAAMLEKWYDHMGVHVHIVDTSLDTTDPAKLADARMLWGILAVVAERERYMASQRKLESNAASRARGYHPSSVRMGYRLVGPRGHRRMIPLRKSDDLRRAMEKIVELRHAGMDFNDIRHLFYREKIMYRTPARNRYGYKLEFWEVSQVKRGYKRMLEIMALEAAQNEAQQARESQWKRNKQPKDQPDQPGPPSNGNGEARAT